MKKYIAILIILLAFSGCTKKPETENETATQGEGQTLTLDSLLAMEAKHQRLLSLAYYEGGGMEDGSEAFEFSLSEGKTILKKEIRKADLTRTYIYEGEESLFEALEAYVSKYNLSVWDELPESEEFALDAPSRIYTLTYKDGKTRIDLDDAFPEGGRAIINELPKMIDEAEGKMQISMGLFDKNGEEILCARDHDNSDEEIEDLIWGYWWDGVTYVYIHDPENIGIYENGSNEAKEYEVTDIVHEPYKEADASWHVIAKNKEDENVMITLTVDRGYLIIEDAQGNVFRGSWY